MKDVITPQMFNDCKYDVDDFLELYNLKDYYFSL